MRHKVLGKSELKVSALCLGTSLFGEVTLEDEAARIVSLAEQGGINLVDTAPTYAGGRAEELLGKLLAGRRSHWLVATKISAGKPSRPEEGLGREWMMRSINASLGRLKLDFVDLLYLHRHDGRLPLEQTVAAVGEILQAGKARYFGFSNYSGWQIGEIVRLCDAMGVQRPVAAQPYYNIVTRTPEVDYLPACMHYGIGVIPYSPLARGVLTGKYAAGEKPDPQSRAGRGDRRMLESAYLPESLAVAEKVRGRAAQRGMRAAEFAVNWLLNHAAVVSVLAGPRTCEQLSAYISALRHSFTPEDEAFVDTLVAPGHPATPGYSDPQFPVTGRVPLFK